MIELIERRDMIRDRFTTYIEQELGLIAHSMEASDWVKVTGPNRLFGYQFPVWEDDQIAVSFCPDVLAAHTAILGDEGLETYLDLVEYVIAKHVFYFEEMDEAERIVRVDSDLYELRPEAMTFFTTVQMAALDMLAEDDDE